MTISPEDKEKIIRSLNEKWADITREQLESFTGIRVRAKESFLRSLLRPLPEMTPEIPEFVKKYTVKEIIDVLLEAYHARRLEPWRATA